MDVQTLLIVLLIVLLLGGGGFYWGRGRRRRWKRPSSRHCDDSNGVEELSPGLPARRAVAQRRRESGGAIPGSRSF